MSPESPTNEVRRPGRRPFRSRSRREGVRPAAELIPAATRQVLELDRLLEWVAEGAVTTEAASRLREGRPHEDEEALREDLACLAEMLDLLERGTAPALGALAEGEAPLRRLQESPDWLEGEELRALSGLLELSGELAGAAADPHAPRLSLWRGGLAEFRRELADILRAIGEDGSLLDGASPELRRLRRLYGSEEQRMRKELERVEQDWRARGLLGDTGLGWREGRPVLPVNSGALGRVQGLVVDQSQSGRTFFVEPAACLEIRTRLSRTEVEIRQEEVRILRGLSEALRARGEELSASWEILLELDHLKARARWGRGLEARVPEISAGVELVIVQGRHPLLARHLAVVPLDLRLGEAGGDRVLLISGPNAGGKTVAMKTAGLFALLPRLGLPLPCGEGTKIPLLATVLTDIGDQQSIENDLSTYSSHLARMKVILEHGPLPGLFLVDELGSGTDPEEGSAVAVSFLERMLLSPGLTVVSTHLGQLKAFAHDRPGLQNACMSFDEERIVPTFRLVQGVPGSSYALEILQRMGMPRVLLDRARHHMGSEQKNLARLIGDLQSRVATAERERQAAEAGRIKLDSLVARYEEKLKAAQKEARELKHQAVSEAAQIVKGASRLVENTVREIRQGVAAKETVQAGRHRIAERLEVLQKSEQQLAPRPVAPQELGVLKVGDRVRLRDLESPAIVRRVEKGGERLQVEAGILKLSVERGRVLEVLPPEDRRERERRGGVSIHTSDPGLRLDLRGRSADEALVELDAYVDDCLVSGLPFATILHGKGTGVLRQVVQDHLRGNPRVLSYRDGQPEEGGDGVTILKLDV
ncbi:MAG: Smr/MutS family protein [Candidatus Delongbacteria bacterium]